MKPLEGITVLDFTQAYNGPYGTMNLADNGARVIKVERPFGGDQSRYWGPHPAKEVREKLVNNGTSAYYAIYNRNKESVAVDLGEPEGKEIIRKLYAKVDVVFENFKYGTMEKLGIDYEVAKEINPNIIFVSASGYGQNGPLAKNTAYDNVIECMCGYTETMGYPDRMPLRSGASVGDSYTGLTAFLGTVLALYRRELTGEGSRIDVAMLDTMFAANEYGVLPYGLLGIVQKRTVNARPYEVVPYDTYECTDGLIAVGINNESEWPGFCEAIGMQELEQDERFATNDLRCANFEEFDAIVRPVISEMTMAEAVAAFNDNKVPACEVQVPLKGLNSEHFKARDMVVEMEDPNVGKYKTFGIPIKYSKTPGEITKPSALLGQDTYDVLMELGYEKSEIDHMVEEEIVITPEAATEYFDDEDEEDE